MHPAASRQQHERTTAGQPRPPAGTSERTKRAWFTVTHPGDRGYDVEITCDNCGYSVTFDPRDGDRPEPKCPRCDFQRDPAAPEEASPARDTAEGLVARARSAAKALGDDTVAQQAQLQFGAFRRELGDCDDSPGAKGEVRAEFRALREIVEEAEKRLSEQPRTTEAHVVSALKTAVADHQAWVFGRATVWCTKHTDLIVCKWNVDWDDVTPATRKAFQTQSPPLAVKPESDSVLSDLAHRIVICNQMLQPERPIAELPISQSEPPRFDPPWHVHKHAGMGDVDFCCKQCGYEGFSLCHYTDDRTVPQECPRCALGRNMPRDMKKY